jgi:hypothetical protein
LTDVERLICPRKIRIIVYFGGRRRMSTDVGG